MNAELLKARTKAFAVAVLKLVNNLPQNRTANIIGYQLGKSASSVAANYRAACRGRSYAEFSAKIGTVEEEADESDFWLGLLVDTGNAATDEVNFLQKEAWELTAIFSAINKTTKQNKKK